MRTASAAAAPGSRIEILGQDYDALDDAARYALDTRIGVLFQHGALFFGADGEGKHPVPMRDISIFRPG